jgi:hypothetical protein
MCLLACGIHVAASYGVANGLDGLPNVWAGSNHLDIERSHWQTLSHSCNVHYNQSNYTAVCVPEVAPLEEQYMCGVCACMGGDALRRCCY